MLDQQQLEVISSQAQLAAQLQSWEASLQGNEAEGPEQGKLVERRRWKKPSKYGLKLTLVVEFFCVT